MPDPSPSLWQQFIAELSQWAAIDQNLFKLASGLVAADWDVLDTTGLSPPPPNLGEPVAENIHEWADPMPKWAPASYTPGYGFSDMYRAYLGALKPSPSVKKALARSMQFRMPDPKTGPYASYTIAPSLSAWYVAALQAQAGGAQPQLDFTIASSSTPAVTRWSCCSTLAAPRPGSKSTSATPT